MRKTSRIQGLLLVVVPKKQTKRTSLGHDDRRMLFQNRKGMPWRCLEAAMSECNYCFLGPRTPFLYRDSITQRADWNFETFFFFFASDLKYISICRFLTFLLPGISVTSVFALENLCWKRFLNLILFLGVELWQPDLFEEGQDNRRKVTGSSFLALTHSCPVVGYF